MKKLFIVASLAMLLMVGCKGNANQQTEAVTEDTITVQDEVVADTLAVDSTAVETIAE